MSGCPEKSGLSCWDMGFVVVFAGLGLVSLAASGQDLMGSIVTVGAGAAILFFAWLWQLTLRRAKTAPPRTRRERVRDWAVFVAWLAVMGALVWWHCQDSDERRQHPTADEWNECMNARTGADTCIRANAPGGLSHEGSPEPVSANGPLSEPSTVSMGLPR